MGLLDGLFGRKPATQREGLRAASNVECPHLAVAPRWDSAADIGHEDRATSFVCDSCHQAFTPSEIEDVRRAAAERLRTV